MAENDEDWNQEEYAAIRVLETLRDALRYAIESKDMEATAMIGVMGVSLMNRKVFRDAVKNVLAGARVPFLISTLTVVKMNDVEHGVRLGKWLQEAGMDETTLMQIMSVGNKK
jgi:hypothetical protein